MARLWNRGQPQIPTGDRVEGDGTKTGAIVGKRHAQSRRADSEKSQLGCDLNTRLAAGSGSSSVKGFYRSLFSGSLRNRNW